MKTCWQISEVVYLKNDTAEGVEPKQEAHGTEVKSSSFFFNKEEINYNWSSEIEEMSNLKGTQEKKNSLFLPFSSSWTKALKVTVYLDQNWVSCDGDSKTKIQLLSRSEKSQLGWVLGLSGPSSPSWFINCCSASEIPTKLQVVPRGKIQVIQVQRLIKKKLRPLQFLQAASPKTSCIQK